MPKSSGRHQVEELRQLRSMWPAWNMTAQVHRVRVFEELQVDSIRRR